MNSFIKSAFIFSFLFATLLFASDKPKFENFTLKDVNGVEYNLSDFQNSKAIVLIFVSTKCPVSNAYNSRMAALNKKYTDKNVKIIGINSNKTEDIQEIKEHSSTNGLNFLILKDWNNVVADQFDASFTPEVYVLSNDLKLLYHGRIDDSRNENNVEKQDLSIALDEILAGKEVSITNTKAFGCTIKRVN